MANIFLPRDAMHKRGLCRHAVSVYPSVTFVHFVKTNTGLAKKLHTELMAITLSILNGFSKFFHCWKAK